jgi:Tfp pilus assembly protein PilV
VEVLVAVTLILVGLVGTVALVNTASSAQGTSRAREGATNLAREVLEDAHAKAFAAIGQGGWLTTELTDLHGRATAVTTPTTASFATTVARRGITYTTTVTWCSVDDTKDGQGPTHSASVNWCADSSGANYVAGGDSSPEDMKRVTAKVDYTVNGRTRTLENTVTFSATGGIVAPSVATLVPYNPALSGSSPYKITDSTQTSEVFRGTSPGAADMKFSVNGIEVTSGVTNQGGGTWDYNWQLAGLTDGTYTISAVALDALGNRSAPKAIQVVLARGAPITAQNVVGGYNYVGPPGVGNGGSLVVELAWDANPEGSVTGYEVLRGATSVCGAQTSLANTCLDANPPGSGTTNYTVKTWYRDANGQMQAVTTVKSVTAPGSGPVPQTYGIVNSWTNATAYPGSGCEPTLAGGGPGATNTMRDLNPTWVTSGGTTISWAAGTNGYGSISACMPQFTSTVSMSAGTATWKLWFTNTSSNKDCSPNGYLYSFRANGTGGPNLATQVQPTQIIPRNTTTPVQRTFNATVAAQTWNPGDQLYLFQNVSAVGPNCTSAVLHFGSGTYQATVTFPTFSGGGTALAVPNAVSGLTVTANPDGTRTLSWTAPTSTASIPAPDFYRVYRDGTGVSARVDTTDSTNTTVASATAASAASVSVASTAGMAVGQSVLVDTGANQDTMTISSIAGTTVTLSAGMPHAHAAGVPVTVRAVSWTDIATGGGAHTYRVSAVSSNLAESAFSPTGGVTG